MKGVLKWVAVAAASAAFLLSARELIAFCDSDARAQKPQQIVDEIFCESDGSADSLDSDGAEEANEAEDEGSVRHRVWQTFSEINPDFIGYLQFDSGIISQPIVQGKDNSFYLNHGYDRSENHMGAVFMDAADKLEDMNIVLYGHNVYADHTAMFSPLEDLTDHEKAIENQTLKIWYRDEVVSYRIVYAYFFDCDDYEIYDYQVRNFTSEEEFGRWIDYVKDKDLIGTGEEIAYGDRLLTLQTCRRFDEDVRLIILCKEYERKEY